MDNFIIKTIKESMDKYKEKQLRYSKMKND